MKHTLKDLTDKDIEAALSSPNVTPNHKLDLTAEVLRRAAQADWDLVGDAFEDDAPECAECEFFSTSIGLISVLKHRAIF